MFWCPARSRTSSINVDMPERKMKKQDDSMTRRDFIKSTSVATAATAASKAHAVTHGRPTIRARRLVRMGVVGGGFGRSFFWHIHPNSKVTAVCDLRDDRLELLQARYECDVAYKDFHDLIADKNVDAVAVFTPAPLHTYMAVEAMKAGKHVISAVPAGNSLDECRQLIDTVKKTGMLYMMAETSFYRDEIIACRDFAREGKFGTIMYSEAEYHHEGLVKLMFDERGFPTWRHGLPPMFYPTHCTGMIIPVTGERLVEVSAIGWGDRHEVLRTNIYNNPFWNTTAFFKTSGGHSARVSVFWHVASGGTERGQFYGDKMSFLMSRPGGQPATIGYPNPNHRMEPFEVPNFWDRLPEPLRRGSGHGGSHTFITHEFVSAIVDERQPEVDVYEAVAYTAPGFYAHQSALQGGRPIRIEDFGRKRT